MRIKTLKKNRTQTTSEITISPEGIMGCLKLDDEIHVLAATGSSRDNSSGIMV